MTKNITAFFTGAVALLSATACSQGAIKHSEIEAELLRAGFTEKQMGCVIGEIQKVMSPDEIKKAASFISPRVDTVESADVQREQKFSIVSGIGMIYLMKNQADTTDEYHSQNLPKLEFRKKLADTMAETVKNKPKFQALDESIDTKCRNLFFASENK